MRNAARVDAPHPAGVIALDIGANKALAVLALPEGDGLRVHAWAERECSVLTQGMLGDLGAARALLRALLGDVQQKAGVRVRRVGAKAGRAGIPAEVMQLVAGVRHGGRADDLRKELEALFERQNTGKDATSIPATFLRVTVTC